MSVKKVLISALATLCAVSLLVPAAFAHGCHGGRAAAPAKVSQCAVCTVPGCELGGRHYHGSTLYCGYGHANGVCSGGCVPLCTVDGCELGGRHYHGSTLTCGYDHADGVCDGGCVSLCTVDGCELTGRHYHDGVIYCGASHSAGYCGGDCPLTQPSRYSRGCHGRHH